MPTEPLSELLGGFVRTWQSDRPAATGGRFSSNGSRDVGGPLGAVSWLSSESGVPRGTIDTILERKSTNTELRIADPLIAAVGRPDAFHGNPPLLPIVPNPCASRVERAKCCSGSETASSTLPPGFWAALFDG